jgi:hypothetical protein
MFVQVIQGKVTDPSQARAALDRWMQELAPGAVGWLGSTAGITDDGTFISLARFESEEAARRNSQRPEQDRWWTETSKVFAGEPTFHDSTDVDVDVSNGDPDRAGFVQIMQGRTTDPARVREIMQQDTDEWAKFRPDVIGSVSAGYGDGAYTMALYFTSEAEAREGERKEPPPAMKAQMDEMDKLTAEPPTFFDIKDPWLFSPR